MLALAPEVAHHRFALIRHRHLTLPVDEEGSVEHASVAIENAKITLECAMHLAGQYASCYDSLKSEENDDSPCQPSPGPPAA
jgi:hypothetical protein